MIEAQHSAAPISRRDTSIDTLRGFACILIVAYHVIGNRGELGMRVPESSDWRQIGDFGAYIGIPLFAFISGYVFDARSSSWKDFGILARNKLLRLGIPLVVVSYIFYLLACTVNSTFCVTAPWWITIFPYAHFWFLQAILIVMVIVLLLNTMSGDGARLPMIAFPISLLILFFLPMFPVDLFSINSAKYLLPFFLLGQILRTTENPVFLNQKFGQVVLLAFGAVIIFFWVHLIQKAIVGHVPVFYHLPWFAVAFTLFNCLFLFLLRPSIYLFSIIGPFSYAIYLFHPIFTSSFRRLFLQLNFDGHGLFIFF